MVLLNARRPEKWLFMLIALLTVVPGSGHFQFAGIASAQDTIVVKKIADFTVTGDGTAEAWNEISWTGLPHQNARGAPYATKVKTAYSESGIYFLFDCVDEKLSANFDRDFLDLWTQDVAEVFLWTDESMPAYFEYEISPLNFELPLLIANRDGELSRWQPFHYEAKQRTAHATHVVGGEKRSGASVKGWTAEFFIPYRLLRPLSNSVPASGSHWRANFYRVDYDNDKDVSEWSWQKTERSFHEYKKFGVLLFE